MNTPLLLAALMAPAFTPLPAHAHGDKSHVPAVAVLDQTAWGIAGKRADAKRTITIDMADAMRFVPDAITVQEGETVHFVVRNQGRMLHEMEIGTHDEPAKHAALMAKFPNMEHAEPYMVHADPGATGEIVWSFNRAGRFEFACLIAGHYEAGMRRTLVVVPRKGGWA